MKSFEQELKKYTDRVCLTRLEKESLRESIKSYIEYHPLPNRPQYTDRIPISTPYRRIFVATSSIYGRVIAGVFGLFLITGLPVMAEQALPGDVLYIVKTRINENIGAQFANSPYEKVNYETKLIERRISEAKLLAREGKLTTEMGEQIAQTVKTHADAAQMGISQIRSTNETDAIVAGIAFDSALEVQSAVLDTTEENATASTASILSVMNTAREAGSTLRSSTTVSLPNLLAKVENETAYAYKLLDTIKSNTTDEDVRAIDKRLSIISRKIDTISKLDSDEPEIAKKQLISALSLTQKLSTFMSDIDVRSSIPLNNLVPEEVSSDDRRLVAVEELDTISEILTTITEKTQGITDSETRQEIIPRLKSAGESVKAVRTFIETKPEELEEIEKLVTHTHTVVNEFETFVDDLIAGKSKSDATSTTETIMGNQ